MSPSNSEAYYRLGVAFYNVRRFHDCIKCCRKAIKLDPNNLSVRKIMARAFYQVEEFDNSLESELKVFEHEPIMQRVPLK